MSETLRGFEFYGVQYLGKSGNQAYGSCVFCGKENKFYTNINTLLWDCKVCGAKGNFNTFLTKIYEHSLENMSDAALKPLAADRKLPLKAFYPWKFGMYDGRYVLPTYDAEGKIHDLRTYKIGSPMRSTTGCSVGLMGLHNLVNSPTETPTYICEGEWDGIAMDWLLRFLGLPGVVVAVPGANTFKREWSSYFLKRRVYCCYDNDEAGRAGELTAQDRLTGVAKDVTYLHWDASLPDGYDLRDLIVDKAIKLKKPLMAIDYIKGHMKLNPRKVVNKYTLTEPTRPLEKTHVKDVLDVFNKWLYIKDFRGIEVALATLISNELQGDPLWMFIVAPPGGSKTEILQSCNKCPNVYSTSSLTAHALISGASFVGGKDPSIIPHLNGKTLIVKDFTTILSKKEAEKEEIFGILRDAYDGSCGKTFGNGQRREYVSHFSILAGVTPVIYDLNPQHQSLGERFLKFYIGDNLNHIHEVEACTKAADNVGSEDAMRLEISTIVSKFIAYQAWYVKQHDVKIPETIKQKIINLARFGARMRGSVMRDRYRSDIISSKPSAEVGTRLVKQLVKLMKALAYVNERSEVTEHEYLIVKKVMLDTISQRIEDVIRTLYFSCPTIDDTLKTKEIAVKTKYTTSTISYVLADLDILGIVTKTGKLNAFEWTLSKYMRDLISGCEMYKE